MGLLFESIFMDLIILLGSLLYYIYWRVNKNFRYFSDRGIPCIESSWQRLLETVMMKKPFTQMFHEAYIQEPRDSPIMGYFTGTRPIILIRDPDVVQNVLVKNFSQFLDRGIHDIDPEVNPLDAHLFNLSGDAWRALRQKLTPTFTSGKLRCMFGVMEACADRLVTHVGSLLNEKKPDIMISELFSRLSSDIIASCAFGLDTNAVLNPDCVFRKMAAQVLKPSHSSMLSHFLRFVWEKPFLLLKIKTKSESTTQFFISLTKQAFEHRLKTGEKRSDFLQLLLELRQKGKVDVDINDMEEDEKMTFDLDQPDKATDKSQLVLTDEFLAAQVFVFILAGLGNTSSVTTFAAYFLSQHLDIQEKLRKEIKEVVKKHGHMSYDALMEMKFLDACINESLRLRPPGEFMFRKCNQTLRLDNGKEIEKGMRVVIPLSSLQKDPKYWDNPDKFLPERFMSGNPMPGCYMPFGAGPRNCIAMRFARIQIKLSLACLLEKYHFENSTKNIDPFKSHFSFLPSTGDGGIWIKMKHN